MQHLLRPPSVPYNLLSTASLGTKRVLSNENNNIDNQKLLQAITSTQPRLSLFWAAIARTDLLSSYLTMAFCDLPPICLPAGFWTGISQSFLQIPYYRPGSHLPDHEGVIRIYEFQTSFYSRPAISVPWSPAPPFGQTLLWNGSLDVREHPGQNAYADFMTDVLDSRRRWGNKRPSYRAACSSSLGSQDT